MPNWCSNTITIKGETETLQILKDNNFSFDFIRPEPDWTNTPNEDDDWRIDNWGTKWDIHSPDIKLEDNHTLVVTGDTAWSPPEEVLRYATERFPDLEINITYEEEGMDFYGEADFAKGQVTYEFTDDLSNVAMAIANDEVSNLSEGQRRFFDNWGVGYFEWRFESGEYDTKDRRWDSTNECFDRTNIGYEWSDEDEEWKEAA